MKYMKEISRISWFPEAAPAERVPTYLYVAMPRDTTPSMPPKARSPGIRTQYHIAR
jgi:hypothetical protein